MEYWRRIFRRIPVVNEQYQKYLLKNEEYLIKNRKEVLDLYRQFHKTIPNLFPRKLEKIAKVEELKYIFHENKTEQFMQNIEYNKQIAREVLDKIAKKEYPPFPTYYPSVYIEEDNQEHIFKRRFNKQTDL